MYSVVGKQVTPMAAVEERAKKCAKNIPHVPVNSIKAENNQQSHRSPSVRKKKATKIPSNNTYRNQKIDSIML